MYPPRTAPQDLSHDQEGETGSGVVRGRNHQHAFAVATEDYIDALKWAEQIGGLAALHARANANTRVLTEWVARTPWVDFLVSDTAIRSNTSVCLKVIDEHVSSLSETGQAEFAKNLAAILEKEGVALDAASYRSAPPGLRIWCGATIEQSDLQSLTPWLDWAFDSCLSLIKFPG